MYLKTAELMNTITSFLIQMAHANFLYYLFPLLKICNLNWWKIYRNLKYVILILLELNYFEWMLEQTVPTFSKPLTLKYKKKGSLTY